MGYDMYKLNSEGEPHEIQSYEDDNYFRLNIWGMGRARELACWGHGLESASTQLKQDMLMAVMTGKSPEEFEPSDYLKAMMNLEKLLREGDLKSHWDEKKLEVYVDEYDSFLEPFGSNWNTATKQQCEIFAEGLETAIDLINSQPIIPEALSDLEVYSEFAKWLRDCPHGVFVG